VAAQDLRPEQLAHVSQYSDVELRAAVAPARLHLWIIVLVSFSRLVALVGIAILLGRRALPTTAGGGVVARLRAWGFWGLVGGLAIGLGPLFLSLSPMGRLFSFPTDTRVLLMSLTLAGAVGSIILGAIALRRPISAVVNSGTAPRAWRRRARLCLIAATLI